MYEMPDPLLHRVGVGCYGLVDVMGLYFPRSVTAGNLTMSTSIFSGCTEVQFVGYNLQIFIAGNLKFALWKQPKEKGYLSLSSNCMLLC